MRNDFEIVEGTRTGDVVISKSNKVSDALAENMASIIDIARDIVEIQKISVIKEATIAKMAEDRKMLMAEADAYAMRKNADLTTTLGKARIIQEMLRDFYTYNNGTLSSEDFSSIISKVLNNEELHGY